MSISVKQIELARTLLDMSQQEFADLCDISVAGLSNIERGEAKPNRSTLNKIINACMSRRVEFIPPHGVNFRTDPVMTLMGKEGFHQFLDDVYMTVMYGGEIFVSDVDDRDFKRWAAEKHESHMERMLAIDGLLCKTIMVDDGTHAKETEYSKYRILPGSVKGSSFYVYGQKLAILQFVEEPLIIVIDSKEISETYKRQFLVMWDQLK